MGLFGRSDDEKRVGFGRRPRREERRDPEPEPRRDAPPETAGSSGSFDTAMNATAGEARVQEILDRLPDGTPDWARRLVEQAAPYAADAEARGSRRHVRRAPLVAIVAMGLFAMVFVGIGLWFLVGTLEFTENAHPASAEVVEVIPHRSDDGTTYSAVVRYTDAAGTQRRGETHLSSSTYNFGVGERVAILYDPADPRTVRIDEWFSIWGFPVIFIAVGLVFETVLVLVFLARRRRRRD